MIIDPDKITIVPLKRHFYTASVGGYDVRIAYNLGEGADYCAKCIADQVADRVRKELYTELHRRLSKEEASNEQ